MYIVRDDFKNLIISFETQSVTRDTVSHIRDFVLEINSAKRIGIDLKGVTYMQNDFFVMLKEISKIKKISLFNISADLNLVLFLTNYNGYTRLYSNESDFKENKRELVKRNFKVA